MTCCRCCEKTGACCNGGACTEETCADCEDAGGEFQGVDTACADVTCPGGACCATDGTCSQQNQADCEAAGGTYKGDGTSCGDYDCSLGCCEPVDPSNAGCGSVCEPGYNASECSGVSCTPGTGVPQPTSGTTLCTGGTPTSVTVTGSGFTAVPGDPAVDACMNASYNVNLNCLGDSGVVSFSCGSYDVQVSAGVGFARGASISVYSFGIQLASMTLTPAPETPGTTACGFSVYPCSPYSGTATSQSGGTGGSIDVA